MFSLHHWTVHPAGVQWGHRTEMGSAKRPWGDPVQLFPSASTDIGKLTCRLHEKETACSRKEEEEKQRRKLAGDMAFGHRAQSSSATAGNLLSCCWLLLQTQVLASLCGVEAIDLKWSRSLEGKPWLLHPASCRSLSPFLLWKRDICSGCVPISREVGARPCDLRDLRESSQRLVFSAV